MAINGLFDPYRDAVSRAGQIRPIQMGRFAVSEKEGKQVSGQTGDKVEFSSEGQQAAAEMPDFDQGLEKLLTLTVKFGAKVILTPMLPKSPSSEPLLRVPSKTITPMPIKKRWTLLLGRGCPVS